MDTLNGARVVRSEDGSTIYIALPRHMWRDAGDCCCRYCSSEYAVAGMAYWDTLAVSALPPRNSDRIDSAWTVHMPEIHGATPKRTVGR